MIALSMALLMSIFRVRGFLFPLIDKTLVSL